MSLSILSFAQSIVIISIIIITVINSSPFTYASQSPSIYTYPHLWNGLTLSFSTTSGTNLPPDAQCANNAQCSFDLICEKKSGGTVLMCQHKDLFPLSNYDAYATVAVFVATALAAGGGVGGGGIIVPIYMLITNFPASSASPLSSATITGGAIANYIVYCRRYHPRYPSVKRALIDYDSALLIMPSLLLGTIFGTMLDRILPDWIIVGLLFILLGYTTVRTFIKGVSEWKRESAEQNLYHLQNLYGQNDEKDDKTSSLLENDSEKSNQVIGTPVITSSSTTHYAKQIDINDDSELSDDINAEIRIYKLRHETRFPLRKLFLTVIAWLLVLVISLLKGGGNGASLVGIICNSWEYWLVIALATVALIIMTAVIRHLTLSDQEQKQHLNIATEGDDIHWTGKTTIIYPLICLACGIAAGLLGIGGGMVVGPILIELGAPSQVVAATSAFTVLVTSSSATVQYLIIQQLPLYYALWFSVLGFIGSCVGIFFIDYLVKKYKKTSLIILVIAIVLVIALVLMGYAGISKVVEEGFTGLRSLCG